MSLSPREAAIEKPEALPFDMLPEDVKKADLPEETGLVDVGLSLQLVDHDFFYLDENEVEAHCDPHTWSNCDARTFNVRIGPDYVPGQKRPSESALYDCFALDGYTSPRKIPNFVRFAKLEDKIAENHIPYDPETSPLPPLVIINAMIPNYRPPLVGDQVDGESFNVVLYASMTEQTRSIINRYRSGDLDQLPESIRLFAKFIHAEDGSDLRRRFKVIIRVANTAHVGFSYLTRSLVSQYNAKPFLARTSTTFYHQPGRYFAVDLDAHLFGKPARAGLNQVKSNLVNMIYDAAFVIEGVENDELPEQILCCGRISKMGIDVAQPFELYDAYEQIISDPYQIPIPMSHTSSNDEIQNHDDFDRKSIDENKEDDDDDENVPNDEDDEREEESQGYSFWPSFGFS